MGSNLAKPAKSKYTFNMKNLGMFEMELLMFSGLKKESFK